MIQRFPPKEKKRHDKTLEAYQVAYVKYEKEGTKLLNGTQHGIKEQAKQYFMNTDYAFKLYNRMYQDEPLILMLETSIGQKPNSPYSNLAMMIPFWNGYDMVEIFLPFEGPISPRNTRKFLDFQRIDDFCHIVYCSRHFFPKQNFSCISGGNVSISICLKYFQYNLDAKLPKIYYSPQGYWKGITAIKKLASTAKVSKDE